MKVKVVLLSLVLMAMWGCQNKPADDKTPAPAGQAKVEQAQPAQPATPAPEAKVETATPAPAAPEAKVETPAPEAKVETPAPEAKVETPAPETKPAVAAGDGTIVPEENKTGKKILIQFFVMSQCPFGVQVMNGIAPVLEKVGNFVEFKMDFIGDEKDGVLTSMHGENEVKGNIVELCAMKYQAENYAYMKLFTCINENYRGLPAIWEECAKKVAVPEPIVAQIKTCFEGQEGQDLLKTSYEEAKKMQARGSPTMFLGGKPYRGGRGESDFLRGICDEFGDAEKPNFCSNLPKPVEVVAVIVEDKRCTDRSCNTARLVSSLEGMFPGLKVTKYDWETAEAKKIYEEEGLDYLPAVMFDASVEKDPGYARLRRYLSPTKSGKYQVLKVGAQHDPKAEICNNSVDDTGNGLVDCDDPTCKNTLDCRAGEPGKLELFVMSQCPFGVKAMNAMTEVLGAFAEDGLKFEIHFIGDEANGALSSMHGDNEVKGDIIELCAVKYYAENYGFMKLLDCVNADYRKLPANWEECAKTVAIPEAVVAQIKTCADGDEGKGLLSEDFKVAKSLGISASPTWIANGKNKFSGIDAPTVQRNICTQNPTFKGCEKKLEAPKDDGAPAGSCG